MTGYILRRLEPHAEHIIERYCSGETYDDIASDHACAWSTIRRLLLSHDVPLRRPESRPARRRRAA